MALWPWVVETKGTGPPSPVDCVLVTCVYVGVCVCVVCGGVGYLRELDTNFLNVLIDLMCMLVHVVSQASSIKLVSH